jgi:LysR family glycine cleavage system transcriptional activator
MNDPENLPPLNALRAFEAAGRLLSFTRAAEELDVTAGAISQQIRLLEEAVGSPLFKRTGRSVELTPTGALALPQVSDAFARLHEAAHAMRHPARKGQMRVSCAPSFAAKWLAPRLHRFEASHPDIQVWIDASVGLVNFHADPADLAIRFGAGVYDGLKARKLLSETVIPVCAPRLLDGSNPVLRPEDLRQLTLLHDEGQENDPSCPNWRQWLKARGETSIDTSRGPRFNQTSVALEAAVAGRGVLLAKRMIALNDINSGRLIMPFPDGGVDIDFSYWAVWPKGRTQTIEVRAFLNWLETEARQTEVGGV